MHWAYNHPWLLWCCRRASGWGGDDDPRAGLGNGGPHAERPEESSPEESALRQAYPSPVSTGTPPGLELYTVNVSSFGSRCTGLCWPSLRRCGSSLTHSAIYLPGLVRKQGACPRSWRDAQRKEGWEEGRWKKEDPVRDRAGNGCPTV